MRNFCSYLGLTIALVACGSPEETAAPEEHPELGAPAEEIAAEERPAEDTPEALEVNLLTAVPTDVAVSSVYRGRERMGYAMFDGELETAWNSRSGDLIGAAIEVRLPEHVQVQALELTAGYTKLTDDRDLFTGNQRVRRLRVSRDGTELGVYTLDPEDRGMQRVPIEGAGGSYRIEVVELVAGERPDWQEVCISELRVLGLAPGVHPEEHFPRVFVGELPEPLVPASAENRDDIRASHRRAIQTFVRTWSQLAKALGDVDENFGEPDPSGEQIATYRRLHREALLDASELVDRVDPQVGGLLRLAALSQLNWAHAGVRSARVAERLTLVHDAFTAVSDWLADDQAACRWETAHLGLRLKRLTPLARAARTAADMDGRGDLWDFAEEVEDMDRAWPGSARRNSRRLSRMDFGPVTGAAADWEAVRRALPVATRVCGW